MDLYAYNQEVAQMEAALPAFIGEARLQPVLALAWHLRQRDPQRSSALSVEVRDLLAQYTYPAFAQQQALARLHLIAAESAMLHADLEQTAQQGEIAQTLFNAIDDVEGSIDCDLLLAWNNSHRGFSQETNRQLEAAKQAALRINDQLRHDIADAMLARINAFRNVNEAKIRWSHFFTDDLSTLHAGLALWVNDVVGILSGHSSDFGRAVMHFMRSYEAALASGQIRSAIVAATNLGNSLTNLNDHHAALEWMQRGLDLARKSGWSASIGACLMQTGETLRLLGQLNAAQELLEEAMEKLRPLSASRNYTIALKYSGDLALAQERYAVALEDFRQLEINAKALSQADFESDAWRGQAHALSHLGQPEAALQAAQAALKVARDTHDAYCQVAALKVLADIHAHHQLLPPYGMTASSTALYYLEQALEVAATIEGFTIPGDLLDAVAREYARMDDYDNAYLASLKAIAAREKTHSLEATNRAIAMQVRYQTEHAQAEGEHHRQLAASAIFLLAPDGQSLDCAFGVENGKPLGQHMVYLSNPTSYVAKCVREGVELLLDMEPDETLPNLVPGTIPCYSKLFAPLAIGERILGVMTVQTPQRYAYGERERLIFRSLCAYGAIALDNANAYRQLQGAQAQLVAQEKLAALGSLVAGVAHELNTPIGNSLMIASGFQEQTDDIRLKLERQQLRHADLVQFLAEAQEASVLILRGLTSAADLVNSFKQVAVDRTTAQRRSFDLAQTCHEIVATMMSQIRNTGHQIELDIPTGIKLTSYPGPLGQVLTNLINNALLHAFEHTAKGHMLLSARQDAPGRVMIQFRDNGGGISAQHIKRIFDPFFTTKLGQGGTGLGLSISYNIVGSLLQGQLQVQSAVGKGTVFTLDIPLYTPEQEPA
ncbi:MAG: GAF domain-containing protein [Burkholderiales bacterium]|nr:GAF domain-containing protein [Burkholderiales bacterium]